jgi:hypothetical protein
VQPPVTLASGSGPSAIAVDATSVYWANSGSASKPDGSVERVPK